MFPTCIDSRQTGRGRVARSATKAACTRRTTSASATPVVRAHWDNKKEYRLLGAAASAGAWRVREQGWRLRPVRKRLNTIDEDRRRSQSTRSSVRVLDKHTTLPFALWLGQRYRSAGVLLRSGRRRQPTLVRPLRPCADFKQTTDEKRSGLHRTNRSHATDVEPRHPVTKRGLNCCWSSMPIER